MDLGDTAGSPPPLLDVVLGLTDNMLLAGVEELPDCEFERLPKNLSKVPPLVLAEVLDSVIRLLERLSGER